MMRTLMQAFLTWGFQNHLQTLRSIGENLSTRNEIEWRPEVGRNIELYLQKYILLITHHVQSTKLSNSL